MKSINIEPGSGTEMAGKWIRRSTWSNRIAPLEIIYVGQKLILARSADDNEEDSYNIQEDNTVWYEVAPPAPEKPKMIRLGGKLGRSNMFNPSENVFWRDDIPPLPIAIEYDEPVEGYPNITTTKTLRGRMFIELPVEGSCR